MKEIKKETKREIVDVQSTWQALDGTIFDSQTECQKYEQSAIGVLMGRICEFMVKDEFEPEFDEGGDNKYKTVVPTAQEHLDVMNQLYCAHGGSYMNEGSTFTEKDLNKPFLMGYRFYGTNSLDWVWFYNLAGIVENATEGKFTVTQNK